MAVDVIKAQQHRERMLKCLIFVLGNKFWFVSVVFASLCRMSEWHSLFIYVCLCLIVSIKMFAISCRMYVLSCFCDFLDFSDKRGISILCVCRLEWGIFHRGRGMYENLNFFRKNGKEEYKQHFTLTLVSYPAWRDMKGKHKFWMKMQHSVWSRVCVCVCSNSWMWMKWKLCKWTFHWFSIFLIPVFWYICSVSTLLTPRWLDELFHPSFTLNHRNARVRNHIDASLAPKSSGDRGSDAESERDWQHHDVNRQQEIISHRDGSGEFAKVFFFFTSFYRLLSGLITQILNSPRVTRYIQRRERRDIWKEDDSTSFFLHHTAFVPFSGET